MPIKDIKTYLQAIKILSADVPGLVALVMGPTDEQPDYYRDCKAAVAELGLAGTVRFTGQVDVTQYFPRIHVNVLTSVSESQPLSVLEAGAAAIPTVATDVGACREILLGRRRRASGARRRRHSHRRRLARADRGRHPLACCVIGSGAAHLGRAMQERVRRYYDLNVVDDAYATIYRRHIDAPSQRGAG